MKVLAWMFIIGVAAWDVWFMGLHSESVQEWECNPVALWLFEVGGMWLVGMFRAAGVFALLVSCHLAGGNWGRVGLTIGVLAHLGLLVLYLI